MTVSKTVRRATWSEADWRALADMCRRTSEDLLQLSYAVPHYKGFNTRTLDLQVNAENAWHTAVWLMAEQSPECAAIFGENKVYYDQHPRRDYREYSDSWHGNHCSSVRLPGGRDNYGNRHMILPAVQWMKVGRECRIVRTEMDQILARARGGPADMVRPVAKIGTAIKEFEKYRKALIATMRAQSASNEPDWFLGGDEAEAVAEAGRRFESVPAHVKDESRNRRLTFTQQAHDPDEAGLARLNAFASGGEHKLRELPWIDRTIRHVAKNWVVGDATAKLCQHWELDSAPAAKLHLMSELQGHRFFSRPELWGISLDYPMVLVDHPDRIRVEELRLLRELGLSIVVSRDGWFSKPAWHVEVYRPGLGPRPGSDEWSDTDRILSDAAGTA